MSKFIVGLDLGQAADYTAVCILERMGQNARGETEYHGRHLQRMKLGTPYPAIVEAVKRMVETEALKEQYDIIADATGVGRPVVDLLRRARLRVQALTITGGDAWSRDADGYKVPKRDLVSTLQVLLQTQRLRFAEGLPEVQTLVKELLNFQVKITTSAHEQFGAWREGTHDDLVLAAAMAGWYAAKQIDPAKLIAFVDVKQAKLVRAEDYFVHDD